MVRRTIITIGLLSALTVCASLVEAASPGASIVTSHGYQGCIKLDNGSVTVILEPNCGGRVIEYALNGSNVIEIDPAQDGWIDRPGQRTIEPPGGRFDIGPEFGSPARNLLWRGAWTAEITGPRSARLTSQKDPVAGVQLIRDFKLDAKTSHLRCTQTIINTGTEIKRCFHWSRTEAKPLGICIIPLGPTSKYPLGYCMYGPGNVINFRPAADSSITVTDGCLVISNRTPQPKFAIDSHQGWFGYITPSNLLLVKRFPTYPDRPYGEIAANTVSIYYNRNIRTELEPIGPIETIKPGKKASFTEDWWLLPYTFPADRKPDVAAFKEFVDKNAR